MTPLILTPKLIAETMNILRSAPHVDGLRLLADALERKLTEPDAPSLEFLLGFATPGPSHARQALKASRDAALRAWWKRQSPTLTATAAAAEAAAAMTRYEGKRWPYLAAGDAPPEGTLERIAHDLLIAGDTLPSVGTIRNVITA